MLRKFALNKIFRTTGMLVLLLLLVVFPSTNKYTLEKEVAKVSSKLEKKEVFLIDRNGYIARTKICLDEETKENYAIKLLELLIIDGKLVNKIPNGFKALLPSTTVINNVKINKNNITIDLSHDIYELNNEELLKAIEMITFNLTTIENIKNVYINVDGKPLSKDNLYFNQPFTRSDGINKSSDMSTYKNTNSTTVYYVSKNNFGYYYVPVTKITNDNREKISIIIDELTSSNAYQTNLMSFLNYNAKLLDYNIEGKVLTLNFNEFLFDDITSKDILEEVIYTISLSVRDNYDVNEVVFIVDNKEITKSVIKNIE